MIDAPVRQLAPWEQVLAGTRRWACACSEALAFLRTLPDCSVSCCVTSPPFYQLRDYGTGRWVGGNSDCDHKKGRQTGRTNSPKQRSNSAGNIAAWPTCGKCGAVREDQQIGLEETPQQFVAKLVAVFCEVRRVLTADGVCLLNMGDTYANDPKSSGSTPGPGLEGRANMASPSKSWRGGGLKKKDMIGIPWLCAFALRDEVGFYLRQEIIWAKGASGQADLWGNAYAAAKGEGLTEAAARRVAAAVDPFVGNPMPHPAKDRCATSHEHLFLFAKSSRYYWDAAAIADPCVTDSADWKTPDGWDTGDGAHGSIHRGGREKGKRGYKPKGRVNGGASFGKQDHEVVGTGAHARTYERPVYTHRKRRSVWFITPSRFKGAHFATFPPKLAKTCILAGCPEGGVVLDPFTGSGTVAQVAVELGRRFVGCELNPDYLKLIDRRMARVRPPLPLNGDAP